MDYTVVKQLAETHISPNASVHHHESMTPAGCEQLRTRKLVADAKHDSVACNQGAQACIHVFHVFGSELRWRVTV
ncbi:hypothetical protein GUJ93_ZPchr0007g4000 [Zizania palustris]|uniref:Uncharacterized protein n=1 Tax=Zizania palustris TaxID=103762 RepID=A0A8J5STA9_ZIZPA|nr:hypothetical protein GUJ93_ZPchr0007g4000 [Zizania palustris]